MTATGGWLGLGPGQSATPMDIEQALLTLLTTIDRAAAAVEEAEHEASQASLTYDLSFARSLVRSGATNEARRKAEALLDNEDAYRAKVTAETIRTTRKERMRALLEQVEIVRSIGASVRTSFNNAGGM